MASNTAGAVVTTAERRERAVALRKQSYTYPEIARTLGISRQAAHKLVTASLRECNERRMAETESLRQEALDAIDLELGKLDEQERGLLGVIALLVAGSVREYLKAHAELTHLRKARLGYLQQRARLTGIAAPEKILVPVDVSQKGRVEAVVSDPQFSGMIAEAREWQPPRVVLAEPAPPHAEVG